MIRVGVVGATGYTGSELLRFIFSHGHIDLTYVTSHSFAGKTLPEIHPHYRGVLEHVCASFSLEEAVHKTDLVFCALPHGEAMDLVPLLVEAGLKVIDLSADFRLTEAASYLKWYKKEHSAPQYLGKAVYGLPEIHRQEIKNASFVANPGCYPTAVLLGLAPLAEQGLIDWETLVVDAKSGTSGAGRVPSATLHFPECAENFRAYKVAEHQHTAEMEQELGRLAGKRVAFTFVPHLLPMIRGILSTFYLRPTVKIKEDEVREIYQDFYRKEKFVRVLPAGLMPETRNVYGSNFCDINCKWDLRTERLIILAALDNLVKGAAGQALQNMNLMLGLEEEQGLQLVPLRP